MTTGVRASERTATRTALVAISHGTSSPTGQAAVGRLVDAVSSRLPLITVEAGFVDVQQPDVPATLNSLAPDQPAAIVPLLLSAGYHVHVDLVNEAADSGRVTAISGALGPDDRLVDLLIRRLAEAGLAAMDSVVLGAAGSSDARAVEDCHDMARRMSARLGRTVTVGFISAATPPLSRAVSAARAAHGSGRVVVSTYLLAPGYFYDLARASGADVVTEPLLTAVGPVPVELVETVCDRFHGLVAEPATS
ncbi:sirohydrochlorin chelatase [Mycetocola zhujimingii]|uniref:sirohydrochlorin chelatase n=1 Tax=Mycetocola zhujimingii TaxID=2079792 RepID=UPI000D3854A1|nr:CbiX/SirB N-terminal domain-containing protein [Mycetocola zhujimingii]AWB86740.1 cobalamin biosynthesis protein CbiX [Mycetocola zhujimingii]